MTPAPDEVALYERDAGLVIPEESVSGHGFKFVPVVGEIIADLVTDGGTSHPIALFDPRRPAPSAP